MNTPTTPSGMREVLQQRNAGNAMRYVIATDSRQRAEVLFMVDRSRQRASFWSNRLDDVMVYADRSAAERKARSLRFNRPRVLSLREAQRIARQRDDDLAHQAGMYTLEAGWDGHKEVF